MRPSSSSSSTSSSSFSKPSSYHHHHPPPPPPPPLSSSSSSSSLSSSPCAACKFLRRKCHPDCVFAPYFPPDNPQKFIHVHRVFGASNVTKLLNDLPAFHREDAVNSLAYEADMRLKDPVYGCVGVISVLQHQLRVLQEDLYRARAELSRYQSMQSYWSAAAAMAVGGGQFGNVGVGVGGGYSYFQQQNTSTSNNISSNVMVVRNNGSGYDGDVVMGGVRMGVSGGGVGSGSGGGGGGGGGGGEERHRVGPS